MKLSVVATLYRSARFLDEFYRRASAAAHAFAGDDYEIVLVNDGSPDDSLELAVMLSQSDKHVVVVDLSRNFGHHKAMMAGLDHAAGDLVFLIDSDLEEAPEWLAEFGAIMEGEGHDVVFGEQITRKGNWFERISGELYYRIFDLLANIKHPRNITTARLMTRRYVEALLQHRERELVISCLWVITGFKQKACLITKSSRDGSSYSVGRKLAHVVNAMTSFSDKPLYLIFYFGLVIFGVSVAYALYLIIWRLIASEAVDGWTSVMVSVWVLGGLMISFVGIIGIYLAKVFSETKQRPYVIVRKVYGN
ncbi:MAG TPA: glycosyltransferase family 2 protein [Microvirga sp.]|jgi:putative glycosyltransferase